MKKIDDTQYLETSKNELIKLLEFVCKNKGKKVFPSQIKNELFPNLDIEEIYTLIYSIKYRHIQPISLTISNGDPRSSHIQYRDGLEEYVWKLKEKEKQKKLHRIVEFLSTQSTNSKQSFDSGEIAKAFNPVLSIYEVNSLCEILIANEDVRDVSTSQSFQKSMMEVLVITRTHNAYHNKRYLEEDKDFSVPIYQNISARNVIVGNVSGTAIHEDNSTTTINDKEKPKWLNILYWIIGALVGLTILYTFIKGLV